MTQPVDVPLLDVFGFYAYPLVFALRAVGLGLVAGIVATVLLIVVLGLFMRRGWRRLFAGGAAAGGVLFLVVTCWVWLSWSDYAAVRVTADGIELRYATWPRPGHRIAFEDITSASMRTERGSGRRGRRYEFHYLVIATKPVSGVERRHWESIRGSEENIVLALQWIEHASGGRLAALSQ
jgi:hypothetical protein